MQVAILVIDSFGIGALPDAAAYGDEGSNTALHICEKVPGEKWPALRRLGLGNCGELLGFRLPGCEPVAEPEASWAVLAEKSPGKDTTTGHWELAGIELERPFHTFPPAHPSFPPDLVRAFEKEIGTGILGNKAASGTAIIEELGAEHLASGKPIVYTSSDSVFQIAAHTEVISIERLYDMCRIARRLCDDYQVGRVIARPFTGSPGSFTRTADRRDFGMPPSGETMLDAAAAAGVATVGVGKIGDIFCERGLAASYHEKGNRACLARTRSLLERHETGDRLTFVNLVDTDMLYGHRRDVEGYFSAVAEVDSELPATIESLSEGDVLVVTGDHGCDPTFRGTDHTREYVPLLWFTKGREGANLGVRGSFADLAQSVAAVLGIGPLANGEAFGAL